MRTLFHHDPHLRICHGLLFGRRGNSLSLRRLHRRVPAILAANEIKFGSPDNFLRLARRLQSDDLLSGDLSRMVKSIFERENDKVSLRTILTIIAIASGGSAVAEADRDLTKPVNLVLDFLICSVSL